MLLAQVIVTLFAHAGKVRVYGTATRGGEGLRPIEAVEGAANDMLHKNKTNWRPLSWADLLMHGLINTGVHTSSARVAYQDNARPNQAPMRFAPALNADTGHTASYIPRLVYLSSALAAWMVVTPSRR